MLVASKAGYRGQKGSVKVHSGGALQCNEQAAYHCLLSTLHCFL